MAQGTVDKRFLTKSAKTASAGALLAFAVVAFLLAGCGGSSDSADSTTAASGSSAAAGSGSEATEQGSGGGQGGNATGTGGAAGSSGGQSPSNQSSSGGGQRQSVPQPTGEEAPKITPQQRREATVASMTLEAPSLPPSPGGPQALTAEYTCDGKNTSPALRWQGVPGGSVELILFAMNLRPVDKTLFFDWAVAGLDPGLEEIEAGKLPKGAVVGRNSFGKTGYGICPEAGEETYIFTLFALPKKLSPAQGFDPLALRKAVTDTSGNVGLLALSYARG